MNVKVDSEKIAMRVSYVTMAGNMILSAFKLVAGIVANSGAMISDAIHSASDVFSTIIVIIGVKLAAKQSDASHPYGHERLECVASIVLAVILGATGIGIGVSGLEKITSGSYGDLVVPGQLALVAAVLSIGVKEWMYWYTRAAAKKINSGALMADAWHHRSDALSSIGALIGIYFARKGYPIMDPIASLVICIFILKAAFDIFMDGIDKMVDKGCPDEVVEEMKKVILAQEGVEGIDVIRTRLFGAKIYVDVEICADGSLNLTEAHEIAEKVHHAIEESNELIKHCMVHVNPVEK
ncbi:MAG: cation transporter [Erysipelotrichaceae bacterium]|nr:cation transporter [Erysipelotrichaceae bacterium]